MAPLPPPTMSTVQAIYKVYEAEGNKPYISPRLGAATAGTECDRDIWLSFRWVTKKVFIGRMLRLFQTGHIEEARMIADLRSAGVTVIDVDENNIDVRTGKPKQWELTDETGHIVCRMDGALLGCIEAPKTWHVFEAKSHNKKSFDKLIKEGVEKSKIAHYAQCQLGMHFSGMERAFYLARCKDTDALWSCRINYDVTYAMRLVARLHRIIYADRPPQKISNDPTWYQCKFCDHHSFCHEGRLPARSCRTCLHISPIDNAEWECKLRNFKPNRDEQRDGCQKHLFVPDLVNGKQTNVLNTAEGLTAVAYEMPDGREWLDMGQELSE